MFQAVSIAAVLGLAPAAWARLSSEAYITGTEAVARAPVTPVALVLGAGIPGGRPSPMLADRLDLAAGLFRAGRVRVLLLSGDNSRAGYDEPTVMRDHLIRDGVPAGKIVLDYAGFDTWNSCRRAREVFGVERLTVVTQKFHVHRAVALCRRAGLDAFGIGADRPRKETLIYATREIFASGKAFLDAVVLDSEPTFPGPRETGVRDALER